MPMTESKCHCIADVLNESDHDLFMKTIRAGNIPYIPEVDKVSRGPLGPFNQDELDIYWYDRCADHLCKGIYAQFLDIASEYFDFSNIVGYETWFHINTRPSPYDNYDALFEEGPDGVKMEGSGWHVDRDERYRQKTNEDRYPLCSMVYYPLIDKSLRGGRLQFVDHSIIPKTNMLVIFSPGVWHNVEQFSGGERISVAINPWDKPTLTAEEYYYEEEE